MAVPLIHPEGRTNLTAPHPLLKVSGGGGIKTEY